MEKIKITQKEIDELYDVQLDLENPTTPNEVAKANHDDANATFEEYTEYYDKKQKDEE